MAGPSLIQYWDAGEPPAYLAERLASFRDLNPDLDHRLFDEAAAARLIDERFGERERAAFNACAVPAMRADYFRYCAILSLGGVYADAGFHCLAPLAPLLRDTGGDGGLLFRRDPPGYLFNGVFLFAAPGHPLLRLALDVATANVERRAAELVQLVTGPGIFSSLFVLHRLCLDQRSREGGDARLRALEPRFRRDVAALAPTRVAREGFAPLVPPLLDAVGESARLLRAFEGVEVASYETMLEYVTQPDAPLPYKHEESDWINWQKRRSIFR